jgi:Fur family ferric uptake transcriptional regulator
MVVFVSVLFFSLLFLHTGFDFSGILLCNTSACGIFTQRIYVMSDLEERCAEAGLKMTGQRRAILEVLKSAEDHPSVEEVYDRAKKLDSSVSIATVYRTLSLLDEMNLVTRHEFQEGYSRYELNWDHHHHLVDLETGEVVEFQNEELERLKVRIARELGYDLVDHRLELYGKKVKGKSKK